MTNPTTEAVYDFICHFVEEHGYSPSLREIGDGCFIGRSTVIRHLDRLERLGWLTHDTGKARSIHVTDSDTTEP